MDGVLPEANRRGIAVLGMKSMCGTAAAVKKGIVKAGELLRYAMSLPVATTISGMDSLEVLRQNLAIARGFKPLSAQEMQMLRDRCAPLAADGHLELYKSTKKYDAAVGREQYGYRFNLKRLELVFEFQRIGRKCINMGTMRITRRIRGTKRAPPILTHIWPWGSRDPSRRTSKKVLAKAAFIRLHFAGF